MLCAMLRHFRKETRIARLRYRVPIEVLERIVCWVSFSCSLVCELIRSQMMLQADDDRAIDPFDYRWQHEHQIRWLTFLRCALVCKTWSTQAAHLFYRSVHVSSLRQLDRPYAPGHARAMQYQSVRVRLIRQPSLFLSITSLSLSVPLPSLISFNGRILLLQRFGQLVSACPRLRRLRLDFSAWPVAETLDVSFLTAVASSKALREVVLAHLPEMTVVFYWLAVWTELSELDVVLRGGQRFAGPAHFTPPFYLITFRLSAVCYAYEGAESLTTFLSYSRSSLCSLALCSRRPPAIASTLHLLVDVTRPLARTIGHLALIDTVDPKVSLFPSSPLSRRQVHPSLPYCRSLRSLTLGGTLYGRTMLQDLSGARRLDALQLDDTVYQYTEPLLGVLRMVNVPRRVRITTRESWTSEDWRRVRREAKRVGVDLDIVHE